uniref:SET domain-containing protein n=1 Tax=Cyclophora tenuis TaxID=216820 RepID=A0A7S1D5T5_CYCTE|mmetsp:Transcript_21698/g.36944  ORF Transcript_21698/g.36944 Transcript_21698/m.36944 type:complete len:203 (+) Transcript_21698:53-661(+)
MTTEKKKNLPWQMHSNCGFLVKTVVKKSNVKEAGYGRFFLEPVKKGTVIHRIPTMPAAEYIKTFASIPDDQSHAIMVSSPKDLEALVDYFAEDDGDEDRSRSQITVMLSWFLSCRQSKEKVPSQIMSHSIVANHSKDNATCQSVVENGYFTLVALKDIAEGQEMFTNYLTFDIAPELRDWFAARGLVDTRTLAERLDKESKQ